MADLHVGIGQTYNQDDGLKLAMLAASANDSIYLHQPPDGSWIYSGSKTKIGVFSKPLNIIGAVVDQKVGVNLAGSGEGRWNMEATTSGSVLQNITFHGGPVVKAGVDFKIRNCRLFSGYQVGTNPPNVIGDAGAGVATIENSILFGDGQCIEAVNANFNLYNCTLVSGTKSYGGLDYKVVDAWNGHVVLNNCVLIGLGSQDNKCCEVRSGGSITGDYNIGTDNTIPGANSTVEANVALYKFECDYNGHYLYDFRTRKGSIVEGKGTDISGLSAFLANDIDGRARAFWDCGATEGFAGWDTPAAKSTLGVANSVVSFVGEDGEIEGGLTLTQSATGTDVNVKLICDPDGANVTVKDEDYVANFVANVEKTFAEINGGDPMNYSGAIPGKYEIQVTVSGGDPVVITETFQYGLSVKSAAVTIPVVVVTNPLTGNSISLDVTNTGGNTITIFSEAKEEGVWNNRQTESGDGAYPVVGLRNHTLYRFMVQVDGGGYAVTAWIRCTDGTEIPKQWIDRHGYRGERGFHVDKYAEVALNGYLVDWYRSAKCPCRDTRSGSPDPDCVLCRGLGWTYFDPIRERMNVGSVQADKKWANSGIFHQGDMRLVVPGLVFDTRKTPMRLRYNRVYDCGEHDMFILVQAERRHSEIIEKGHADFLRHRCVEKVISMQSKNASAEIVNYVQGVDFDIAANATQPLTDISWLAGGTEPDAGTVLSVVYNHRPQYVMHNSLAGEHRPEGKMLPKIIQLRLYDPLVYGTEKAEEVGTDDEIPMY